MPVGGARSASRVCRAIALLLPGHTASAADLETVLVGDAGNETETLGFDCRTVAREHHIGEHDIADGQCTAFLNPVAARNTHDLYCTSMWRHRFACKITRTAKRADDRR